MTKINSIVTEGKRFFIVYMQLIMKFLQETKYIAALLCEIVERRVYQD